MPRRKVVAKRPVLPDSKYNDLFITRCVNVLMKQGKKSLAEHIMYGALEIVRERTSEDPLKVFRQAVDNVKPVLRCGREEWEGPRIKFLLMSLQTGVLL